MARQATLEGAGASGGEYRRYYPAGATVQVLRQQVSTAVEWAPYLAEMLAMIFTGTRLVLL